MGSFSSPKASRICFTHVSALLAFSSGFNFRRSCSKESGLTIIDSGVPHGLYILRFIGASLRHHLSILVVLRPSREFLLRSVLHFVGNWLNLMVEGKLGTRDTCMSSNLHLVGINLFTTSSWSMALIVAIALQILCVVLLTHIKTSKSSWCVVDWANVLAIISFVSSSHNLLVFLLKVVNWILTLIAFLLWCNITYIKRTAALELRDTTLVSR